AGKTWQQACLFRQSPEVRDVSDGMSPDGIETLELERLDLGPRPFLTRLQGRQGGVRLTKSRQESQQSHGLVSTRDTNLSISSADRSPMTATRKMLARSTSWPG